MALAGLDGGALEGVQAVHPGGPVGGEGVARLVGEHVHVPAGAHEVGEDEGGLVVGQLRAVAAGGLALPAEHVQQLAVVEEVNELLRLGAELVVHLLAGGQDVVGGALGLGVAVGEQEKVVVDLQAVHADALGLVILHPGHHRHQVRSDLAAEGGALLGAPAVAAQAVVAQGDIVLIAHGAALGGAVLHQLVIELVQLLPALLEPPATDLVSGLAHGPVGVLQEGSQLGQREGFAPPLHHSGGIELLVFAGELVLLLHQLHDLRLHAPHGDLQVGEQQRPEPLLQLGAELRSQQGQVDLLAHFLEGGADLVQVVALLLIELVPGVDGMAGVGQGEVGADLLAELLVGQVGIDLLLGGGGGLNPLQQPGGIRFDLLQVRPGVRHFCKFHRFSFLPAVPAG